MVLRLLRVPVGCVSVYLLSISFNDRHLSTSDFDFDNAAFDDFNDNDSPSNTDDNPTSTSVL